MSVLSPGGGGSRNMESSLNKPGYHNTALIAKQLTHQVGEIVNYFQNNNLSLFIAS